MADRVNEQPQAMQEEYLDVLTKAGVKTGVSKPRGEVHRDGDYHRAVHVWIFAESTQELLLQKRSDCKDSWAGLWDISSAGHISAGDSSLLTARRELHEELGIKLPEDAFELLFVSLEERVMNDGKFINNEYRDVYLITTTDPIPLEVFILQDSEVSDVRYIALEEYRNMLRIEDPQYVPYDVNDQYGQFFEILSKRYKQNTEERYLSLQKKLNCYARVSVETELTGLNKSDKEALSLIVEAASFMDQIFFLQVWHSNPSLRDWLEQHAGESQLSKLKWMYYLVNKSPWSCLDENEPFLTTADSAVKLLPEATKHLAGWKGLEYRVAFPIVKPPGASFYPSDMDKLEFELWKNSLPEDKKKEATGFFSVIRRGSEIFLDESLSPTTASSRIPVPALCIVPFSKEYYAYLSKASDLLHKAGDLVSSSSLKKLLHSKADAFLSDEYYDSDIAWMELDSKLDVSIGPYETYEDVLFGYKATFDAFIGVRDDDATTQVKLFGDQLQFLEKNLPMDDAYKNENVRAYPIRVINLIYNSGDLKGPQPVAFNLPTDEQFVKDRGSCMVMLKNVSQAKFQLIIQPIVNACIVKEQQKYADFDSYFTFIICHECCHGIGPHSITLPNGKESTVRLELQELHSALEEAKADIVGLWAIKFLVSKNLLPKALLKSIYVLFLVVCFRSARFGLEEAHGKGQALQFNYLLEKGSFILHRNGTFSVDFDKVEDAIESLSREILTIQGRGDKGGAETLFAKHCMITQPLKTATEKLNKIQVPVDILPEFPIADKILGKNKYRS
ncbi:nudix hydrolase 3-like [Andrographis paniculata]|uniref:nudix hydrolase 3-like n=1 Tax=Andrographis paniculata TaxID=175694 RepID=UPI0021E8E169|nr:nudix hydrolase 3-like [Andrographis paniculata]